MKSTMIELKAIPHSSQRYDTVGDWEWDTFYDDREDFGGEMPFLKVACSELSEPEFTLNVQIHEMLEALLCREAGITQQQADDWDIAYEEERKKLKPQFPGLPRETYGVLPCGCIITLTSEPGDDKHAPYHEQHVTATMCEMIIGAHLKLDWVKYITEIEEL